MIRILAVALLVALLPAVGGVARAGGKEKDIKIADKLTKDDPKDKKRGFASKTHIVNMKAGNTYTIDMVSMEFDAYLRLEDPNGKELAEDDDSGGNQNARIVFGCTKDGPHRVICTCYAESTGNYTLTVKKTSGAQVLGTPHAQLIGKTAPDFEGDFAINGKAVKLADLKGKVVLLDFWTVQSGACAATLPRLRDWSKAHKDAGLEIIGVTYYPSEMGLRLSFDKQAGKLTSVEEATMTSDEAMFTAIAAYHKLDYVLLTLHKRNALNTFDAYAVNGVPQLVLIDRNGIVRFIRAGEVDVNTGAVESELKTLLAEK
jgi:thiol-disulfide isomerase/thioredoxin